MMIFAVHFSAPHAVDMTLCQNLFLQLYFLVTVTPNLRPKTLAWPCSEPKRAARVSEVFLNLGSPGPAWAWAEVPSSGFSPQQRWRVPIASKFTLPSQLNANLKQ